MNNLNEQFRNFISLRSDIYIEADNEESFSFKFLDLFFIFESYKDDPYYFRILLPNIYIIEQENQWIEEMMDRFTLTIKVAHLVKKGNYISAIADGFAYSTVHIEQLFQRMLSCLETLYNEFKNAYLLKRNEPKS